MELKDFITTTLNQIAEGVNASKATYVQLGGAVNPKDYKQVEGGVPYGKSTPIQGTASLLTSVEFEVALTNENLSENSAGIGVLFGAITLGGKLDNSEKQSSLTRVKFNIPVKLP